MAENHNLRSTSLMLAYALTATGCADRYVDATSQFADATSAGMTAFVPAFDTAAELCHASARYDYAAARLQNSNVDEQGNIENWSKWMSSHDVPGQGTWEQHCAKLAEGDAMLLNGLRTLSRYADALSAVADAGNYDGGSITTLANDSLALGEQIKSGSNSHTDTVKDLAGPIGKIAGWITQTYARRKLRDAIKSGAPHCEEILDALMAYNDATKLELAGARTQLAFLLDAADKRLAVDAHPNPNAAQGMPLQPDGMTVLGFHDSARAFEQELDSIAAKQAAYGRVLAGLKQAQLDLVAAADENEDDAKQIGAVLTISADVILQIDTIKSAVKD